MQVTSEHLEVVWQLFEVGELKTKSALHSWHERVWTCILQYGKAILLGMHSYVEGDIAESTLSV